MELQHEWWDLDFKDKGNKYPLFSVLSYSLFLHWILDTHKGFSQRKRGNEDHLLGFFSFKLVSGPWSNSGEIFMSHRISECRIPPAALSLLVKTLRRMAWIKASWVRTTQLHLTLYWQQVVNVDGSAWLSLNKAHSPFSISSCVITGELFGYMWFLHICHFN